jgi:hypothetical protein
MHAGLLISALALAQSAWAVISDFPHVETFEHGGALPSGWISDPASGDESWACRTGVIDGPDADHTSGSGYFVRVNNTWRTTLTSWLYLPPLDLSGMMQPAIAYWYCVGDESASGNEAYLYLEAKQGESWVQVGTTKRWTPYFWIESLDSLAAHQSTNTLLRFRVRTDSTAVAEDVCIDDLRIFDNTNAPAMPALQAPAHGASGAPVFATLRWEQRAGLTGYRLYVGTDGGGTVTPSNLHNGLALPGTASRYGLDDLSPSTTYYWRLVAVNSVGDSPASPIRSFTTGARTTVSAFPHTQNMSNGGNTPAGWINGFNDDGTGWVFSKFYSDHTTGSGYYAYVDVNYQKPITSITSAFVSPRLDLSGTTYPKLSYWYRKDNSGNYLYVYVFYNGAWRSASVASHSSQTSGWVNKVVDLTPYKSADLRIRFEVSERGWWNGDIPVGLDDVTVYDDTEIPLATTVVNPTNNAANVFTRGTLQWQSVARADDYLFSFGTDGSGSALPSNMHNRAALGNVTTRAFSGLAYGTAYRWAITPKNQIGEATNIPVWTFTTLAQPPALPFEDDFETDLSAWVVQTSASGTLTLSTEDAVSGGRAARAEANNTGSYTYGGSSLTRTFSPASNPQLAFWYRVTPGDYADLSVDVFDGTWHNSVWSGEADAWTEVIVDLAPYNTEGGEFMVRINLNAIYTTFGGTVSQVVYLDDLRLFEAGGAPLEPHTPAPADGATEVPITTPLYWLPGLFTTQVYVYGSTNALAVTNLQGAALWAGPVAGRIAHPPMLDGGATYYWRVVSHNSYGSTTGAVWRFTTATPTVLPLPHAQTFGSGLPAAYETQVNAWAALRHDATRNSALAAPNDGLLVMEGGGSEVVYWQPGNPALLWDYAAEGGDNWRNTARFTLYLQSPGGPCDLLFDYKTLLNLYVRDINLRVDIHKGGGWQQVGPDFYPDSTNANWTRVSLDLGTIPVGTFALRFWSSVKYSEDYNSQGILLDNLLVQGEAEGPGMPYGPVPNDGETAAFVTSPLTWSNGADTDTVDLYFSANEADVEACAPAARVVTGVWTDRYDPPAALPYSTDYAWRVVALGANGLATTGTVWSFTTQPDPLKTLPYATGFDLNPWADGWSRQGDASNLWSRANTAAAGGQVPEMFCDYGGGDTARLVSPPLDTAGSSFLNLSFKHRFIYYEYGMNPLWLRVQTSADGETWSDDYVEELSADVAQETFSTQVAAQPGGVTYVAFTLSGSLWDTDGWWVDDVAISASLPPQPPWSPQPSVGFLTAHADSLLTWSNGVRTVTVDLYLGTAQAAVESLDPATRRLAAQPAASFDPGGLAAGARYWWRVVARGNDGQTAAGPLWSFRVRSALPLACCYQTSFAADPWDEGWTQQNEGCDALWGLHATPPVLAGGTLPEFGCFSDWSEDAVSRLVSPPVDTRDGARLCVRFRSAFGYFFSMPENVEFVIQASSNAVEWVDEAVWLPTDPAVTNICLGRTYGDQTYVAWTIRGDLANVDYWVIDDVLFHPALVAAVLRESGQWVVHWNGMGGSTGSVVRTTTDLKSGEWSAIAVPAGSVWTNTLPGATRFFKVEAKVPDSEL